mmetsp:Transcript_20315/g.45042  ORF Transcript_20315/g.45042 Transcript_20315/m.45042 type:complete len:97 (-) Transcript_20315:97-387(-)
MASSTGLRPPVRRRSTRPVIFPGRTASEDGLRPTRKRGRDKLAPYAEVHSLPHGGSAANWEKGAFASTNQTVWLVRSMFDTYESYLGACLSGSGEC